MDLKETEILGDHIDSHWYYQSKAKAVAQLIRDKSYSSILDVGAGSGYFSKFLLNNTAATEAWCVDISYEEDLDQVESNKSIHFRRSIGAVNVDLVLFMDVLEHVDNDVGLLKEYVEKVPKGTTFLISVPAFNILWSDHDVFLEHKRRYTVQQIERTAASAGLNVVHGSYYFGAIFPIAAATRLIGRMLSKPSQQPRSQLKLHHPLTNRILASLSSSELSVMRLNRIAGLTAFCLATKN